MSVLLYKCDIHEMANTKRRQMHVRMLHRDPDIFTRIFIGYNSCPQQNTANQWALSLENNK